MRARRSPLAGMAALTIALTAGPALADHEIPSMPVQGEAIGFGESAGDQSVERPFVAEARFTPLDLLRRYFTDLNARGEYRQVEPIALVDDAASAELRRGKSVPAGDAPLVMPSPTKAVIRSGRFAYGFVVGGDVLVGDRLVPVPGIADALYVRTDVEGHASILGGFMIGEETPAALVLNSHGFAGGDYQSFQIVAQRNGRLHVAWRGLELHSVTLPDGDCAGRRYAQRLSEVRPLRASHFGYADIAVAVTEMSECATDGREEPLNEKVFRFTLKWQIRTDGYAGGSPELVRRNSQRLGM